MAATRVPMVAASPEVDTFGLVLPRVNLPHSGWPLDGPALRVGGQRQHVGPADRGVRPAQRLGHRLGHRQHQRGGRRRVAPAYPGFDVEVEALNRDPSPVEHLTVPAIMAHLESVVERLDSPPILMGIRRGARSCSCCSIAGMARWAW